MVSLLLLELSNVVLVLPDGTQIPLDQHATHVSVLLQTAT